MTTYVCPMHPQVTANKPGTCSLCGMALIEQKNQQHNEGHPSHEHHHGNKEHNQHQHGSLEHMNWWEKFKMSMTMSMGMDHTGIAGREMAAMMEKDIRNKFFFSLILTIPIVLYSPMGRELFGVNLPIPFSLPLLLLLLTTPVFFYGGWLFLYSSYQALKHRNLNMSVLIAVGISAAYFSSILLNLLGSTESFYEAAAMLITFVLFGHWMEMKSRRGTTDALQALFSLVPPQARVLRNGKEMLVVTADVLLQDVLILKPGDKIAVDGEIIEGESAIDESLITGESLPVSKTVGDQVIGGSINQSGTFKMKALKVGDETALAHIVKMVETAQNSKAPGQKLADRFAKYLVFFAVGAGLLTFVVWYVVMAESFLMALTFAISAVVIACPDALGLATPTAVAVGTGIGARHNILIKDAATLESVSRIQAIVFDKTGTLTEGKPTITDIIAVKKGTEKELLRLAASIEAKSNHPLSKALLRKAEEDGIQVQEEVVQFKSLAGLGIEASIKGENIVIGTMKLMETRKINIEPIRSDITALLAAGKTLMIIAKKDIVLGVIAVTDEVRSSAKATIKALQLQGIEVAMITGDNKATAEAVGKALNINRIFAEVLPENKAEYVQQLQKEGKFVAMVGDGINDAPALAQADIGIAIGAGTDVAIETAKVVLMKSDPSDVLKAIVLSRATIRKMKQNLFWASIYNILAVPLAAGILYPTFHIMLRPEIAALLMSISSIIVAVNAVSLKRVEKHLVSI